MRMGSVTRVALGTGIVPRGVSGMGTKTQAAMGAPGPAVPVPQECPQVSLVPPVPGDPQCHMSVPRCPPVPTSAPTSAPRASIPTSPRAPRHPCPRDVPPDVPVSPQRSSLLPDEDNVVRLQEELQALALREAEAVKSLTELQQQVKDLSDSWQVRPPPCVPPDHPVSLVPVPGAPPGHLQPLCGHLGPSP